MNRFLTQLPIVIASLSLALIKAITDQLKWLGSFYYHIETAVLGTLADISLAILSFRYVFLLLVIGGGLAYFQWWWGLAGYVLIILIAVVRMFQLGTHPPTPEEEVAHQELRDKSVKFLRMPMWGLAMLVSLYFSWQFFDWQGRQFVENKGNELKQAFPSVTESIASVTTTTEIGTAFQATASKPSEPIEELITKREIGAELFCFKDASPGKYTVKVADAATTAFSKSDKTHTELMTSVGKQWGFTFNSSSAEVIENNGFFVKKNVTLEKHIEAGTGGCFKLGFKARQLVIENVSISPVDITVVLFKE